MNKKILREEDIFSEVKRAGALALVEPYLDLCLPLREYIVQNAAANIIVYWFIEISDNMPLDSSPSSRLNVQLKERTWRIPTYWSSRE